jgi:hypothetical protein
MPLSTLHDVCWSLVHALMNSISQMRSGRLTPWYVGQMIGVEQLQPTRSS